MNRDIILAIRPTLSPAPGDSLAVSEPGSPLRVGVVGDTESEARERFNAELAAWAALSEKPDPADVEPAE
jgi:hypothetical protein